MIYRVNDSWTVWSLPGRTWKYQFFGTPRYFSPGRTTHYNMEMRVASNIPVFLILKPMQSIWY